MTHGQIQDIPIEKIGRPVKLRDRCSRTGLKSLAATMRHHGQLCPVLLTPPSADGLYGLLDGSRRVLGAKSNGATTIRGMVLEGDISEAEAIEKAFISNTQREELNPIALAKGIATHIAAKGSSASESATGLGVDVSTGSKLLHLLRLPIEIQEQIANGTIPWTAGYQLTQVDDASQQAELAAKIADKQLTRDELSAEVKRAKKGRKKPRRKSEKTVVVATDIGRVAVTAREFSLEVFEQCLQAALDTVRQVMASGGDVDQLKRVCGEGAKAGAAA